MDNGPNGVGGLGITYGNPSPAFQDKKTVFCNMAQLVEVFVISMLFLAVLFGRDYGLHRPGYHLYYNPGPPAKFLRKSPLR
jgi:hypothetical protein